MTRNAKQLLIVCCAILVFGIFMAIITPHAPRSPESRASAKANQPEISGVTWAEIDQIYNAKNSNTELQKKEQWKKYKGKIVRWSGEVSSVGETFGALQLQIKMNPETFISDLVVRLEESERTRALELRKGQRVTFTATLEDWGQIMPFSLSRGAIDPA